MKLRSNARRPSRLVAAAVMAAAVAAPAVYLFEKNLRPTAQEETVPIPRDIAEYYREIPEFEEFLGVPLFVPVRGEMPSRKLAGIAQVLLREQAQGQYVPRSIRIASHRAGEMSHTDRIMFGEQSKIEGFPQVAYYHDGRIVLRIGKDYETHIHHELSHGTFRMRQPDRTRWASANICDYAGDGWHELKEYAACGFISALASQSFEHDVVVTAEVGRVLDADGRALQAVLSFPDDHPVRRKLRIAEEDGLVPQGLSEYLSFAGIADEEEYLQESEEFLARHPSTVYTGVVRLRRGKILGGNGNLPGASEEFLRGLEAYGHGMQHLRTYKELIGEWCMAVRSTVEDAEQDLEIHRICREALEPFSDEDPGVYLHALKHGSNDVLRKTGRFSR